MTAYLSVLEYKYTFELIT